MEEMGKVLLRHIQCAWGKLSDRIRTFRLRRVLAGRPDGQERPRPWRGWTGSGPWAERRTGRSRVRAGGSGAIEIR